MSHEGIHDHLGQVVGDDDMLANILAASHPNQAKSFGRKVRNYRYEVWVANRFDIVLQANLAKFGQNVNMRDFLLGTGSRIFVEASPLDRIWGIGLKGDHTDANNPTTWRGLNLLGFVLMETRVRLESARLDSLQ
jgi:hypothetical protein